MFGSETWTLRKKDQKRSDAQQMRFLDRWQDLCGETEYIMKQLGASGGYECSRDVRK
jgi:hypothetical protein